MTDQTPAPTPAEQPAAPAAPAYAAAPGYAAAPAKPWNVLSIISLVTSILWISLVGIITGHIALSQIKRTGEQGRGLAIAGLIIGYVGIVGAIIFAIVWIGIAIAAASYGVYTN
ncbi:MAG: hypothetical protein BGO97_03895 [Micrococcales bacterium 70-64]|nr:DUF4190 domain-containing protein [Leifsonia sp.]ODU63253.1 MAG: hypothetical protein ABT06_03900 [Leifsonia sp. SCN 70-46]OJX84944.1 MAG: hypothetical protein BGO97_03895 [Micrococcales bacterium 70-64]